jgi:hypothetical protein
MLIAGRTAPAATQKKIPVKRRMRSEVEEYWRRVLVGGRSERSRAGFCLKGTHQERVSS